MSAFPRYFHPQVSVQVTPPGLAVSSVSTIPTPLHVVGHHIAFRITRTMTQAPDSAEVAIYNLASDKTLGLRSVFAETGKAKLLISCGYDGVSMPAFLGDIRKMPTTEPTGADQVTKIQADDAGDALTEVTLKTSTYLMSAETMIDVALAAFAVPPPLGAGEVIVKHPSVAAALGQVLPQATAKVYTVVSIGKATDLLDEAARIVGARWWVANNQLFMATLGLPTDPLAAVLTPSHLLSIPSDDGAGLVHVDTFCDPTITPGRAVTITPVTLDAADWLGAETISAVGQTYRCEASTLQGDSEGTSPWINRLTLRRVVGLGL